MEDAGLTTMDTNYLKKADLKGLPLLSCIHIDDQDSQ